MKKITFKLKNDYKTVISDKYNFNKIDRDRYILDLSEQILNNIRGARAFTKDEAQKYNNSLLKLFKPTGRKLFED